MTHDLFTEQVLVLRSAFMEAQGTALIAERQKLLDDGWSDVLIGTSADLQEHFHSSQSALYEYDAETTHKLDKLQSKQRELEAKWDQLAEDDQDGQRTLQAKLEELERQERELTASATRIFAEPVKAVGTVLLVLDPDGQVRHEYRIPAPKHKRPSSANGNTSNDSNPKAATFSPDDLSERQTAELLVHRTLAVRQAVLNDRLIQKRLLVLMLHDKVRLDALAIKRDKNAVSDYLAKPASQDAPQQDQIVPAIMTELVQRRVQIDPFHTDNSTADRVDEAVAYERLKALTEAQLDELIAILIVQTLSASLCSLTPLIELLATELSVEQRRTWMPNANWLNGYKKPQLAHLMQELLGPVHANGADQKKKSVLVGILAKVFVDAIEGHITDAAIADKINRWLPAMLRQAMPNNGPVDADTVVAAA